MTTFIMIDDVSYLTDTAEEIAEAKTALREAGLASAKVYVGEPDGLGDSYANGQVLWAGQESTPMKITVKNSDIEQLRAEAAVAGDIDQVALCDAALDGDAAAWAACEKAIRAAIDAAG